MSSSVKRVNTYKCKYIATSENIDKIFILDRVTEKRYIQEYIPLLYSAPLLVGPWPLHLHTYTTSIDSVRYWGIPILPRYTETALSDVLLHFKNDYLRPCNCR